MSRFSSPLRPSGSGAEAAGTSTGAASRGGADWRGALSTPPPAANPTTKTKAITIRSRKLMAPLLPRYAKSVACRERQAQNPRDEQSNADDRLDRVDPVPVLRLHGEGGRPEVRRRA